MKEHISLLIPTHNRHLYLERLLEYYSSEHFSIYVLDSSPVKYNGNTYGQNVHYYHLPDLSFASKIEFGLSKVETAYMFMCADDDFILPSAVCKCVEFLEKNQDYSVAMGHCLYYYKEYAAQKRIVYTMQYHLGNAEENDPKDRLNHFLKSYTVIFYGVFKTSVLQIAFKNTGTIIQNLFLSEYITAIYPIVSGKCKILPSLLYIVNEAPNATSGTRTSTGIVEFISNKIYNQEYESFINHLAEISAPLLQINIEECRQLLFHEFTDLAELTRKRDEISTEKRIGTFIKKSIPFIGDHIISFYRNTRSAIKARKTLDISQIEKKELKKIEALILRFSS